VDEVLMRRNRDEEVNGYLRESRERQRSLSPEKKPWIAQWNWFHAPLSNDLPCDAEPLSLTPTDRDLSLQGTDTVHRLSFKTRWRSSLRILYIGYLSPDLEESRAVNLCLSH
jgi:hypothetical protein